MMILFYIVYIVLFLISLGTFARRIIADVIEYLRCRPKGNEQPFDPARVTVNGRESSGLSSFTVWDIYLNGDNIGKIGDGAQATAALGSRNNILEARGPKGAVSELKFSVQNGAEAQTVFKAGKFAGSQEMSIVMPAGNAGVFDKIAEGFNSKKLWAYWAVLIGCYAAVFALSRALGPIPTLILAVLPLIVILLTRQAVRRAMGVYLYYDQPEAWGRTAHEMVNTSMWRSYKEIRSLYYDQELAEQEYTELRDRYDMITAALIFSVIAYFAAIIYSAIITKGS